MLLDKQVGNSQSVKRSKMHKMNPARVDREDERKMLPCRNFLDGFCPRGQRCRFYHPAPSALPTVIRVPNLPTSFQHNSHFGQYPLHGGHHSLFSLSPTSSRSYIGLTPKMSSSGLGGGRGGNGGGGASRYMNGGGMNGFSHGFGNRPVQIPVSPTYSEYEMAYAQEMELQKEKERRASAPPPEQEETMQNTVFSHIDWKEFLTPGARPPPPTHVPYMSNSPGKPAVDAFDSLESLIRSAGTTKITSPVNLTKPTSFFEDRMADIPQSEFGHPTVPFPTGTTRKISPHRFSRQSQVPPASAPHKFSLERDLSPPTQDLSSCKAMSAKEELQLKVKQIAKELASEPAQHVQSLDTFFRNYTFQSIPTAPSSEQDLVNGTLMDMDSLPATDTLPLYLDEEEEEEHEIGEELSEPRPTKTVFNPKVPAFTCSSDSGLAPSSSSQSFVESNKSSESPDEEEASTTEQTPPSSCD